MIDRFVIKGFVLGAALVPVAFAYRLVQLHGEVGPVVGLAVGEAVVTAGATAGPFAWAVAVAGAEAVAAVAVWMGWRVALGRV